jgi:dihydropyrimidinase
MLNIIHLDDGEMYLSFESIKRLGGVAMVHCEDFEIARKFMEPLKAAGRKKLDAWNDCRPDFVEHKKIIESAYMAWLTGCPLYVVHNTVGTVKEVVDWARGKDVEMHVETCPAYLSKLATDKINLLGKVNPPIRTKGHVEALWRGIHEGWVDCMGTDHCALTKARKVGQGDIWSAMLGYPGSETLLPFMISEGFNRRGVPLQRIAELTATKTAEIHQIPNKGAIRVGYDADITLVDLKKRVRVTDRVLHYSKVRDFNLFEGETFTGYPVLTLVRGTVVAQDHEIVGKRGYGRVIKRQPRRGRKKPTLKYLLK